MDKKVVMSVEEYDKLIWARNRVVGLQDDIAHLCSQEKADITIGFRLGQMYENCSGIKCTLLDLVIEDSANDKQDDSIVCLEREKYESIKIALHDVRYLLKFIDADAANVEKLNNIDIILLNAEEDLGESPIKRGEE